MTLINATYIAIYDDRNGCDEVPCKVDDSTLEVTEFMPAVACRWNEDAAIMCEGEWIRLDDGREFEAIKTDEYDDAVASRCADEYDRDGIVLFDADKLAEACQMFAVEAVELAADGFDFRTCAVNGSPVVQSNTETVSDDIHDAAEHMSRAVRTMKLNNQRVAEYNVKWPGFYDEYLAQANELLATIEGFQTKLSDIEHEVRMIG